jgi:hypothetical protein
VSGIPSSKTRRFGMRLKKTLNELAQTCTTFTSLLTLLATNPWTIYKDSNVRPRQNEQISRLKIERIILRVMQISSIAFCSSMQNLTQALSTSRV